MPYNHKFKVGAYVASLGTFGWMITDWSWESALAFAASFAAYVAEDYRMLCTFHDGSLARKLVNDLPSTGVMRFIREVDFGAPFSDSALRQLDEFLASWVGPEHDFANPRTNALKKYFIERAHGFRTALAGCTRSLGVDRLTIKYSEFTPENDLRFKEEKRMLNDLATDLAKVHADLLKTALHHSHWIRPAFLDWVVGWTYERPVDPSLKD